MIDVNVHLARWPFRRLPCEELNSLVEHLRRAGVRQAWVGSFEGLFHRDLAVVNSRLARQCAQAGDGLLVPFGSINPLRPDWRDDLRRCQEQHAMPGIRLHPNYHAYRLDEPAVAELFDAAAERELIVQLALSMDDMRSHHPLMQVPDVDVGPLPALVARRPGLRLVVLNALHTLDVKTLGMLARAGQAYFDLSTLDDPPSLGRLLQEVLAERLLFGSHFPLRDLEDAVSRFERCRLTPVQREAVAAGNAARLLRGAGEVPWS